MLSRALDQSIEELERQRVVQGEKVIRRFETGATRSPDASRPLFTGYFSPLVIQCFGEYMTKHRVQTDGSLRDPDNWQRGMPLLSYLDGIWRHFSHLWLRFRGFPVHDPKAAVNVKEDLCAIIFNAQGYLHQLLLAEIEAGTSAPGGNK